MTKSIIEFFALIISIVSGVVAIFTFYLTSIENNLNASKIPIIILMVLVIILFIFTIFFFVNYRRPSRYAEIFDDLNKCFHKVHSIEKIENPDKNAIKESLNTACGHIANAFEKVSGKQCSVCIKFLTVEPGTFNTKVKTICRDPNSSLSRSELNSDLLSNNTAYLEIAKQLDTNTNNAYYLCNNLVFSNNYKNSRINESAKCYPPIKLYIIPYYFLKLIAWPLDYKSTLVVPLKPLHSDHKEDNRLRGFLCIDSVRIFSFSKRYDINIARGISDGLYNMIDLLKSSLKN